MLLPDPSQVDMADLGAHYDWPGDTWLRACLVMSVDGALAGPDGLSGSLSSPADRAVLAAVRSNADAYLVGAATVRAEGYRAVRAHPVHGPARVARGQLPAPVLAVVSASCRFDWDAADFPASDQPPLVLTTASAAAADRAAAVAAGCTVMVVGEQEVGVRAALAALHERSLTRIVAEGGPSLLGQLAGAGSIDEVDLTISPTLAALRQPADPGGSVLTRMDLHHVLEEDGYLFCRYVRRELA
jgi:riboflavin biosynthesis pyrimidine reductase